MSTAIVKFKQTDGMMFYCKYDSYPAGLGFDLLGISSKENPQYLSWMIDNTERFCQVFDIPQDIQYEYIIDTENNSIHCQECWYTPDKSYHGGGFRHGGIYDLKEWKEKVVLQNMYSYRNEEAFEADRKRKEKSHT